MAPAQLIMDNLKTDSGDNSENWKDVIGTQSTFNNTTHVFPTEPNVNSSGPQLIDNTFVQAGFFLFYTAIFIIGIFGNVLVCYVVLRNKAMQTVTNIFITNLALSDILLCILAVPFTPLYTFLGRWVFGKFLCHLVSYAQGCSVYISTLTLTSIAMDRFFVIIYPFHPRMKICTCFLIITSIWVISLLMTLPYGLYMSLNNFNDTNSTEYGAESVGNHYCEEDWPSEISRKLYGSVTTVLQFVLPFLIISVCYICVSLRLNDRAKAKPGSKTSKKEEADRERKKRTNRMLISMVAVFGISWLPLNSANIINDFYEIKSDVYTLFFFISHCIAMSSTCYNPFLYAWLNETFRKEFKRVLPCFRNSGYTSNFYTNPRESRGERTFCRGNNGNDIVQEKLLPGSSSTRQTDIVPRSATYNDDNTSCKRNNSGDRVRETSKLIVTGGSDLNIIKTRATKPVRATSGILETPLDYDTTTEDVNDIITMNNNEINNKIHC